MRNGIDAAGITDQKYNNVGGGRESKQG